MPVLAQRLGVVLSHDLDQHSTKHRLALRPGWGVTFSHVITTVTSAFLFASVG